MHMLLNSRLPAELSTIVPLAEQVGVALSTFPEAAFAINLCLEELVTNTVKHGLKNAPGHEVQIRIQLLAGMLDVQYQDDAPAFNPFEQAARPDTGLGVEQRPIGGLGVHLIRQLVDVAEWTAGEEGGGNLIRLQTRVSAAG